MHNFMAHFCILFGTFFGIKSATGADMYFAEIFLPTGTLLS